MEKCSHCGALLGGTVELTSGRTDLSFLYAQGDVTEKGNAVFGEETIISLANLRSVEFYYTGSRHEGRLTLTYNNDDNKIYLQGSIAENLFDQLRRKCDMEV